MAQKHILDAIAAMMDQRGVSQGELAQGLGCSQTTISRLLRGLTQLTIDDLFKIAKVLQVNPAIFIDQAMTKAPTVVTLPTEVQNIFCQDAIGFQLFNRLKLPMTFNDLSRYFTEEQLPLVRKKIADLKKLDAVIEDIDGKLRLNYPDAESLYVQQDVNYNTRITEVYGRLRETKGDLTRLTERELDTWKRSNGDAVFYDYFTKTQVEEQKSLVLQLFNFIRSQQRANRMAGIRSENAELRSVIITTLPYPVLKGVTPPSR